MQLLQPAYLISGLSYLIIIGFVHLLMPEMTPLDDNLKYVFNICNITIIDTRLISFPELKRRFVKIHFYQKCKKIIRLSKIFILLVCFGYKVNIFLPGWECVLQVKLHLR